MNANERFWKNWQLIAKFAAIGCIGMFFVVPNLAWFLAPPFLIAFIIYAGWMEMKSKDGGDDE